MHSMKVRLDRHASGGSKQKAHEQHGQVVLRTQVFTSAHKGQQEMSLLLCQGNDCCASRNKLLGQFHLRGFQPAPAGTPKIEARPYSHFVCLGQQRYKHTGQAGCSR